MPDFNVRGIALGIPNECLSPKLTQELTNGRYENREADALLRHLRPGDRLLDLGAGAGYLCCLAASVLGPDSVTGVEAGPVMAQAARLNLRRNAVAGEIIWGAVVSDDHVEAEVAFSVQPGFWASSLATLERSTAGTSTSVPALRLGGLLGRTRPTVLSCDIEGAEQALFRIDLPSTLRLITMEIHPAVYGAVGTQRLFSDLSVRGFVYTPKGSHGATVVFERLA